MDELTHIRHAANCTCSNVVGDLQQPWQSILFHCEWYRQLSVGGRGSRLIRLHCSCCAPLRLLFLWFNEALSYGPAQSAGRPRGGQDRPRAANTVSGQALCLCGCVGAQAVGLARDRGSRQMRSWQLRCCFVFPLSLPRTNQPSNQNRRSLKAMKKMGDLTHQAAHFLRQVQCGLHRKGEFYIDSG